MQSALSNRALVLLFLFSVVIWFGTLDYRKLVKPDEGRYAEIAREMVVSGDWLTPRLNGIKYFEKPPMQYWATAATFEIFGFNEWTARLWTALTGFLTMMVTWWAGKRLFGPDAGIYAGMVLGSSLYFIGMGHVNTLDMGLTFFTTLAMVGFTLAQHANASRRECLWGMLITWGTMAFAVLSKGLVGIVLPAATLALYTVFSRDWTIWRRLYLGRGLLLFLAIAAPWFISVSIKNPEFPWFFFIHEHFLRYATSEARREGPVYYFLPILLIGILPWVFVVPESIWTTIRQHVKSSERLDKPALILLLWTIFIFAFFSFSSSKLPSYILPIFPSLALLMGKSLARLEVEQLTVRILPVGLLAAASLFFLTNAASYSDNPVSQPLYRQYGYWLQAAAAIMSIGIGYACWQAMRKRKQTALTAVALAAFLAGHIAVCGHETLATTNSAYHLAEKIRPHVKPDIPFYSVKMYDQTLPFYLNRTLTLVDYRDEFDYGLQQQPELAISNMNDFRLRWAEDREALALMQPETYEALRGTAGYAMEVVANDGKRVVVKKHQDNPK